MAMKLELGDVIITPKVQQLVRAFGQEPVDLLRRHQRGDWGDVTPEQRRLNHEGLRRGLCVVSCYDFHCGQRVTIFTRPDRSCTFMHVELVHATSPMPARA